MPVLGKRDKVAIALATTGASVNVSNAAAPVAGQVPVTTSPTQIEWQSITGVTGSAQTFSGLKSFSTGWEMAESGPRSYKITTRTALTTFPVPSFRPSTANTNIAVDIMPNGSPGEYGGTAGIAWFDVCDADILTDTSSVPLRTARVGVHTNWVEFGSNYYNGATALPIRFAINHAAKMVILANGTIGIGTTTPTSTLTLNGSLARNLVTKTTATYTVLSTDTHIVANYAGTMTVTLPAASSFTGREIILRTITANTVVSASSNVAPLAGGAAGTAILAATAGKFVLLVSDGTNWQVQMGN